MTRSPQDLYYGKAEEGSYEDAWNKAKSAIARGTAFLLAKESRGTTTLATSISEAINDIDQRSGTATINDTKTYATGFLKSTSRGRLEKVEDLRIQFLGKDNDGKPVVTDEGLTIVGLFDALRDIPTESGP